MALRLLKPDADADADVVPPAEPDADAELDVEPHAELDVVAATNMLPIIIATKPSITTAATTATTINNTIATNIAATRTSTTTITTITAITTKSIIATNTVHAAATHVDADADVVEMDTERNREDLSLKLKPGTHSGMVLTGLTLVWRVSVMAIK